MEDVIFSGTRDRNPTGMAEVSLSLIDPEVYSGPDASEPTQIDIQNDIPPATKTGTKRNCAPRLPPTPTKQSKKRSRGKPRKWKALSRQPSKPAKVYRLDRKSS